MSFTLHHDAWSRLVLIDGDGRRHVGVEPVRVFPITDPEHWISICDAQGREIVCLERLDGLTAEVREVLEGELARREFIPEITRIVKVSGNDPSQWNVTTDRGEVVFFLKSDDDIRRVSKHRVLVIDAHGVRYSIRDTRALDATSRRLLERYL